MRRDCEAGTSATTAAVSVADATCVRSTEGLQSAEEQIVTEEQPRLRAERGGAAAGGDSENTMRYTLINQEEE